MIYDMSIAWNNIRNRPVQSLVPVLVIAIAIALSVAVFALADGVEEGIVQASDPFGVLVIGAAGSGQQLVLSSVLLQGNPIGNIPYDVYESLRDDARVQLAVPLAFGDSVGGARIIGTNLDFFELRTRASAPPAFQIAEGRLFTMPEADHDAEGEGEGQPDGEAHAHTAEAVLGSKAAASLGLRLGDEFLGTHGIGRGIAENVHENVVYTVVGILRESGTAYDTAVYTPYSNVWEAHADHAGDTAALPVPQVPLTLAQEAAAAAETDQVTSVLVLPTGFIEQNQLAQQFYVEPTLQAAFPGQELGSLLNLLDQGQAVLEAVGYLMLVTAALTLFLSMYSAVQTRQQAIAIMRGLGSNRQSVFRVILFETLFVSVAGAILGRVIGYGLAVVIAGAYSAESAIPVPIRFLPDLEAVLWVLALGVGLLAGLVPAAMAYRVNVVERLFPT